MGADVSEMTTLSARIKTGGVRVGAASAQVLRRTTFAIQAEAQQRAPVDTGHLRSSILTTFEGDGRSGSMTGVVTANADYSGFVEFGTSTAAGQPFMAPAFESQVPVMESVLASLGAGLVD